jgi:hypothetical protein
MWLDKEGPRGRSRVGTETQRIPTEQSPSLRRPIRSGLVWSGLVCLAPTAGRITGTVSRGGGSPPVGGSVAVRFGRPGPDGPTGCDASRAVRDRTEPGPIPIAANAPIVGAGASDVMCFGRIDRSTSEVCSRLDVNLCVCHLRPVNGYTRRRSTHDESHGIAHPSSFILLSKARSRSRMIWSNWGSSSSR